GQVEFDWSENGTASFGVYQMGMKAYGESGSAIEECLREAIRHSKNLGQESVAEVTCKVDGPASYVGKFIKKTSIE
ncbi:MAG TPA: hypothetical protein PLJ21_11455, partial [Pseudobdellovibrionaceae bacterium]|nr:hypothetical protein [Pseudobdellovibrionaceae bacterium]